MDFLKSKQKDKTFYKWVCDNGVSNFIGFDYSQYIKELPSKELPIIEKDKMEFCKHGYHFTDYKGLHKWMNMNSTVEKTKLYKIKPIGAVSYDGSKYVSQSIQFTEYIGEINIDGLKEYNKINLKKSLLDIIKIIESNYDKYTLSHFSFPYKQIISMMLINCDLKNEHFTDKLSKNIVNKTKSHYYHNSGKSSILKNSIEDTIRYHLHLINRIAADNTFSGQELNKIEQTKNLCSAFLQITDHLNHWMNSSSIYYYRMKMSDNLKTIEIINNYGIANLQLINFIKNN